MPRQNRRHADPVPAAAARTGGQRYESWRGVDFAVRPVTGSGAGKPYRCPGCDQEILPGRPHVVAWPADDANADGRRHWHSACWSARGRRAPGIQRSRSAPRY